MTDWQLIAEAGNVYHETGMTPGQMQERIKLLEAQKQYSDDAAGEVLADAKGMRLELAAWRERFKQYHY